MLLWMACAIFCSSCPASFWMAGPICSCKAAVSWVCSASAQLDGVGLHHGLQILLEGIGKLLLQPGSVQQVTHGFGKQRLEGLGLHIGGKTDLIQIQQAVADEIALVAVQDLFHQRL